MGVSYLRNRQVRPRLDTPLASRRHAQGRAGGAEGRLSAPFPPDPRRLGATEPPELAFLNIIRASRKWRRCLFYHHAGWLANVGKSSKSSKSCCLFGRALKSDTPQQWQRSLAALQSKVKAKLPDHAPLMLGERGQGGRGRGGRTWNSSLEFAPDHYPGYFGAHAFHSSTYVREDEEGTGESFESLGFGVRPTRRERTNRATEGFGARPTIVPRG